MYVLICSIKLVDVSVTENSPKCLPYVTFVTTSLNSPRKILHGYVQGE